MQLTFRAFMETMRVLGILTYRVEGAERLREPGRLIVANHPTLIDVVLLVSQMPEVDCIVKRGLWRNPFLRWPVSWAGYLPTAAGEELIEECSATLRRGHSLLVFPEGTRTVPGKPLRMQRGAAHIALAADSRDSAGDDHLRSTDAVQRKSVVPRARPALPHARGRRRADGRARLHPRQRGAGADRASTHPVDAHALRCRAGDRSRVTWTPPNCRGWRSPRSSPVDPDRKAVDREVEMSVQSKSREEILEHLRVVLSDQFELEPEQIVPDANLYTDLDLDSIDAVDLFLTLKEITGRKIQPQAFKDVRTVNDVIDAIQTLTSKPAG